MNRLLKVCLSMAFLVAGAAALPGCNGARDTALNMVGQNGDKVGFNIKTLTRGDRNRKYGLFVPLNYTASKSYPVIIFLHGMGEGGGDAHANLRVGLAPFVADRASDFPFICLFPQSDSGGWDENSQNATDIFTALDDTEKAYNIDKDRVSLTGLSTGGYGTWAIGAKYKDRFAALVPMGSNAQADKYIGDLVGMPIKSYHNGGDPFAAVWNDESMCSKVNGAGGHADFYRTDGPGHDCWEGVYADGELFTWLLQQRRHGAPRASVPASTPVAVAARSSVSAPAAVTPVVASPVRSNAAAAVVTPY